MELNLPLDSKKLNKLKEVCSDTPIYCFPVDLTKGGLFTTDSFVGATKSGIFLFENEELNYHPFDKIEKIINRVQTNGTLITVKINGEEYPFARCSMRYASGVASVVRGANLLLKGEVERRIQNNDKEKHCPKCGRILRGTAVCPKCNKTGGNLKRFFDICRENKLMLMVIIFFMLLDTAVGVSKEYILRIFVDNHLATGTGTVGDVLVFFAIYFGVILIGLVIYFCKAYFSGKLGVNVVYKLRKKLSVKLQELSLSNIDSRNTGELVERIMGDTTRVSDFLNRSFAHSFNQVFYFITLITIMLIMNWKLALISFSFVPFMVIFTKTFWPKIHRIFSNLRRKMDVIQNKLQDVLSGIRIVKTYGKEKTEIEQFRSANENYAETNYKNEKFFAIFYPIVSLVFSFGTYFIIYAGGLNVLQGQMTPGELMQFVAYTSMLLGPIHSMTFLPRDIINMSTSLERIYDVLGEKPKVLQRENAISREITGDVQFKDVVFGYSSHEPVLDGVTLDVKAGEMIGLVGSSGAGKSTLINLVMRLYDVDEGSICIDGVDIRDYNTESYHSQIGVVLQETFLFAGSVLQNIRFSNPNATMSEIIMAAKVANAHDFICRLPDGYNTYVGEKGHSLSGGEKQRIAIARAILNNPKILILDEATSALDTESEYLVQQALERLRHNRTTFAIAHRLSTLRCADRIAVVDDHKIAEIGSHNELLKKKGIYYNLVMAQLQMNKTADKS
ncbi:MAG: ABC transporter ATP-binding protein [Clostridia bacterium]|nr:ABC transporter ATP-binding protein [Clostridia bacterium]